MKTREVSLWVGVLFCFLITSKSLFLLDDSSIVPWLLSFKRGTALEEQGNKIVIKETGYFFIYGQVRKLNSLQHLAFKGFLMSPYKMFEVCTSSSCRFYILIQHLQWDI